MAESLARTERAALKAHIAHLEGEVAFLRGLLAPTAQQAPLDIAMESGKLYTSEDEEDAKDLLDEGIIDLDDYRSMLDAAGALNTDVDFHTP